MEVKFEQQVCRCLRQAAAGVQHSEQTQEVRLPDAMPDIGRVLGAWGQVMVRGKQWRSDSVSVNGGVSVWVLYAPEDGSAPRSVEAWIPFQMKWELPDSQRDGTVWVFPCVKSMDARSISARKLMVRANIGAYLKALEPAEKTVYRPGGVPEDVQLKIASYPLELPQEAGEKLVSLEEELETPEMEQVLRFGFTPVIEDRKVLAGRLVFRGSGHLEVLYLTPEGKLGKWQCAVPFSQYTDLDREHSGAATAGVTPVCTSVELDRDEAGKRKLRASMAAQYIISDRVMVEVAEDAYSPTRAVTAEIQELMLPLQLDAVQAQLTAQASIDTNASEIVDVTYLPGIPQCSCGGGEGEAAVDGQFQVLYRDENGALQGAVASGGDRFVLSADDTCTVSGLAVLSGEPQGMPSGEEVRLEANMDLFAKVEACHGIPMVTALEIGEEQQPDPNRPSLVLLRAGDTSLWDMARRHSTTVEAIRKANRLVSEPEKGQLLLIPVP